MVMTPFVHRINVLCDHVCCDEHGWTSERVISAGSPPGSGSMGGQVENPLKPGQRVEVASHLVLSSENNSPACSLGVRANEPV